MDWTYASSLALTQKKISMKKRNNFEMKSYIKALAGQCDISSPKYAQILFT